MNPATQILLHQIDDEGLHAFVGAWDTLEALAVAIYRGEGADRAQSAEFDLIIAELRERYPRWQPKLDAHWRATKINDQPAAGDPFKVMLELPEAAAMVGNWEAMQTLPAAREALNRMLVEMIESEQ